MEAMAAPVLGVRDVRKAAEYYRDVLGFDLDPSTGVYAPEGEPQGVYAIVRLLGAEVHLQVRRGPAPPRDRGPYERDAYIFVPSADTLYEELLARGATALHPPADMPYGLREFTVEDPEGHRVSFGTCL